MLSGTIRVKFRKVGNLQFISHLDLMRFMTKALVRAKIPVVYTEGFNPHPRLTFGLPLSVGTQSECELMEFKITGEAKEEDIRAALSRNLPPELAVLEVYQAPAGVKLSSIAFAEYEIRADRRLDVELVMKDEILATKQTKSGEKTVNIAPLIARYSYDGEVLRAVLCADSQNYLNPELLVKLFDVEDYTIVRTACYMADAVTPFR